jgi:hypothetical protein
VARRWLGESLTLKVVYRRGCHRILTRQRKEERLRRKKTFVFTFSLSSLTFIE